MSVRQLLAKVGTSVVGWGLPSRVTDATRYGRMTTPAGGRTRLLDLRPGDCAHLPIAVDEPPGVQWSAPVTITGVLLIDTELVQVRWSPEHGQDPFAAHLLLSGPAYRAGAIRCRCHACDGHGEAGITVT